MKRRRLPLLLGAFALLFFSLRRLPRRETALPIEDPGSANAELLAAFPSRASGQFSILLLADSQQALPAKRALEAAGISFAITRDLATALRHALVFIPADDRSMKLSLPQRDALKAFVEEGGTLILQAPMAELWRELTGIERLASHRGRRRLSFLASDDPALRYLDEPQEREVPLASAGTSQGFWTSGLAARPGRAKPLAVFPETGESAILRRGIGRGAVYTLGVDLRDGFLRPQAERDFDAQRRASDGFEPGADAWALFLRAAYESRGPAWARLRSLPRDWRGLVLLSHELRPGGSLAGTRALARLETSRGRKATYFIQTKYAADALELPFYDSRLAGLMKSLAADGHELASLSVADSPSFANLSLGDGSETPRSYRPYVGRDGRTWGASLLGELGASKALIERDVPGQKVLGFRSPQGLYPELLDEALARGGFSYDSSLSANGCLTHFPFALMRRRGLLAESGTIELPVTFGAADSAGRWTRAQFRETLAKVSANEGWVILSQRPSGRPDEAGGWSSILAAIPDGVKTMTLGEAARYWSLRSRARFWLEEDPGARDWILRLELPEEEAAGLSFELSRPILSCDAGKSGVSLRCAGRLLIIERSGGTRSVTVRVSVRP